MYVYKSVYFLQENIQPIHAAAAAGKLNVVQLLIDVYGIDPTVKAMVNMKP